MAIKIHPSIFVHPGPWLARNAIEPYKMTTTAAAEHLGVTRAALSALLNGRAALSATMALRFEKAFGLSAETLLRMQISYDLAQAEERRDDLAVARLPMPA
ncbi:HigA family addiction module antitoxin [uncultured Croceicoccus sp.]|uniref:HigA family addiction module antitoxin n=1 Tax=uncultured Croceicoccus sp. TaxID=1295329 RepID=UPI002627DDF7|nr:HigA family addiction module antitoxin [uncultured Croceicoccus sp.]